MPRLRSEALVGVFVVAAFAILIWGTMQISQMRGPRGYDLRAVFENISGLDLNAPVRMVGVKVGKVKSVGLDPRGALVVMEIDRAVSIPHGSVLSIRSMGILGDKYVEIKPGKEAAAYHAGDTVADTAAGADIDKLLSSLQGAGSDLSEILAALKKVVATEKGTESLKEIVENLRRLTGGVNAMVEDNRQRVDRILANLEKLTGRLDGIAADNREEIRASIANIREISERLKSDLPRLTEKFEGAASQVEGMVSENREDVRAAIAQIRKDAEQLEKTLESVTAVAKKIEKGEGTVGKLINEDTAYNNLNQTLEGVNKYLRKGEAIKFNVDIHGSYLTETHGSKGYVTLDIHPSPDKFYRLELVQDSQGNRTWEREITTTTPGTTVTTERVIFEDKFKFSLELGKRFHSTILRLGYIESSFGMGFDRYFMDDNLRLTADFWDFNRDENANSRLVFSWRFLRFFHVDLGGEDFFNKDRKPSLLLGLGLSFVDDDLKYVLGSMPSLPR